MKTPGDWAYHPFYDIFLMAKRKQIAAKPTQYRNILFRSVLEARTAVMLDAIPNILNWSYESKKFQIKPENWDYTPDFEIKFFREGVLCKLYMEVKPAIPNNSYQMFLYRACKVIKPYLICYCPDYYHQHLASLFFENGHSKIITLEDIFDKFWIAFEKACKHRFDIP